jgi:hypothetical protein
MGALVGRRRESERVLVGGNLAIPMDIHSTKLQGGSSSCLCPARFFGLVSKGRTHMEGGGIPSIFVVPSFRHVAM